MLPVGVAAQKNPFETGNGIGSGQPWEDLNKNTKTRIKLDYHNSNIDAILSKFQEVSGITIVKDPTLTGGLTITSAKSVSVNEAFQILSATLKLKNYEIVKDGTLLIIRQKPKDGGGGGGFDWMRNFGNGNPGGDNGGDNPWGGNSVPQLKVYVIKYANASQIARVVNDVFAATPGQPFPNFGGGGGRGGFGGGRFGGGNNGGGGGNNFMNFMQRFGQQQNQPVVKASSDDFSNSVIVNAPRDSQVQVAELIGNLDKQTDDPVTSRVFTLEYASSDDLVSVIQNLLSANVPRGRGGATTQQTQGPGAFLNAIRGQTAGAGSVTSDPRTNSLIVSGTKDNLDLVAKVVQQLDTKVQLQTTTFVFPLANAQATDVANLLNQAFGQRQGVNGARTTTQNTQNRTTNNNSQNRNNNGNNRFGGLNNNLAQQVADNSLPIDIDPNSQDGELMTSVAIAQGFGGFGQNQQRRTNGTSNSGPTTGRDASGRMVNTADLTNQVTTIADPNTNSIIVVTSPENAEVIRKILDQLDKIPEQVMIETIITEASLTAQDKLGVEWKFAQNKSFGNSSIKQNGNTNFGLQGTSTTTDTAVSGFDYTITGGNLGVFINALQSDSKFQILSTPRIFTSNNVQAEINISQSVPYITSSRQDINGNFTYTYAFEPVGIVLTVTPHITKDGYVTMDVDQSANDLQGYTTFNAPIVNQRTATTTVSVKDGDTVVIGGIIRNTVTSTVNKVPLLGDIPLLGNLFKSRSKEKDKTELLVFLTPRIVRDPAEAKKLKEETQKEMSPETQKGLNDVMKPTGDVPPAGKGDRKKNGGN